MPVRRIGKDAIPRKMGGYQSSIAELQEWKDLVEVMNGGLKPYQAVEVDIKEAVDKLPGNRRVKKPSINFRLHTNRYIKKNNLPLDCFVRDGIIYVVGR